MTKREKRLQKIRQNPKNVSFEDLRQVMEDHGFIVDRSSGSHYQFRAAVGDRMWKLTIPFHRPHVKTPYVSKALRAIDEIIQAQSADGESEKTDEDTD
jgi:predicted RNA binding protein YcfA (HicA-like mRNA interferase family)